MKNSKTVAFLLAAALMTSALASCGETEPADNPADSVTPVSAEQTGAGETEPVYPALEVRDLGGNPVNILIRSEWNYEFKVEEETGELVSDSILKRNNAVEDRYHCELNFIDKKGDWNNHDAFGNAIHASVLAGDGAYDFIAGYQACLVTNIENGDFLNLLDLPHFAFDAPWWTRQGLDALTINGKCYEVGGDIAVSLLEGIFCMFFNKTLAQEYDIGDIYQTVSDGKWTHEALMSVIKGVSRDLDGNSVMDENDLYGFATSDTYIRPYIVTYDTPTLGYDTDGDLICVWNNAKTVSVLEKLVDMAYDTDVHFAVSDANLVASMFRNGQTLIIPSRLGISAQMRDMEDDFGIIPYPKWDESQQNYLTTTLNEVTMMTVPLTAPDPDMSALMIEAMCREANTTIAPAFYEHALKGKYTRDENSAKMVDLIRSSLSFDTGWINSMIIGVSGAQYFNMIKANDKNFESWYASQEATIQSKLDAFKEFYFG